MLLLQHFLSKYRLGYSILVILTLSPLSRNVMGQSTLDSLRKENAVIIGKVANGNLTFHPLFNSLSVEREIAALIYGEGLLTLDDSGTAIEGLAYLPVKLSGGLDWIFRLKQGVVFHDGEPLTSEDVIFTYMQYKAARVYDPIFHRYFQNIHDLSALDYQTVRFENLELIDHGY